MESKFIGGSEVLSDPLKIYQSMLDHISRAQKSIYLESFRFENDPVGIKFRYFLSKKARAGVRVILLLDDWGTSASMKFFKELINAGGEVKFFKKIRLTYNLFLINHERNHRKLLVIDDEICFIGSLNIVNYNLNWREISLKLQGNVSRMFSEVFLQNLVLKNTYKFRLKPHIETIGQDELEIIRDVPSVRYQKIRKRMVKLIRASEKEVMIETPYFLPTYLIMNALIAAARRKVVVTLVIPWRSDVRVADILRNYYLGRLFKAGVIIRYYTPANLHSKTGIFDNTFYIGSSNFDYRSFRYMFEIGLFGKEQSIYSGIRKHIAESLSDCIEFDYEEWANRRKSLKLLERLLLPFKHFL